MVLVGSAGEGRPLAGLRILAVEDYDAERYMLERALRNAGAEVVAVASADEAFEALDATPPHLLVSDILLPGTDGYELVRRVRELESERGWHIPAIAVTVLGSREHRDRALDAGFTAHLAKPVSDLRLVDAIRDVLHVGG
jgi:CheY-like chemotaxis protein